MRFAFTISRSAAYFFEHFFYRETVVIFRQGDTDFVSANTARSPNFSAAMATSRKGAEQVRDDYQALWSNMQQAQRQTDDTEVRAVCDQLLEALALRVRYLPGPMGVPGADGGADRTRSAEQPFEPPPCMPPTAETPDEQTPDKAATHTTCTLLRGRQGLCNPNPYPNPNPNPR